MNFQDYIRYDAVGLAELIRKKEVSADEVLQAALSRLDEVNPKLNLLAHDLRERAAAWQGSSENADAPLAARHASGHPDMGDYLRHYRVYPPCRLRI